MEVIQGVYVAQGKWLVERPSRASQRFATPCDCKCRIDAFLPEDRCAVIQFLFWRAVRGRRQARLRESEWSMEGEETGLQHKRQFRQGWWGGQFPITPPAAGWKWVTVGSCVVPNGSSASRLWPLPLPSPPLPGPVTRL